MTFDFDPIAHVYRLDGRVIPSVTQLLKPIGPDLSAIPRDVLERKRALGQAVHLACELDDKGELDEASTDPQVMDYVQSWRAALKALDAEVVLNEFQAYHPVHKFAGTLDRVLRLRSTGENMLTDIKTAAEASPSWGVQLEGYRLLIDAQRVTVQRRAAIMLSPTKFQVVSYSDPNDEACFRALLSVHQWKERHP